jgi:hypothetical protein
MTRFSLPNRAQSLNQSLEIMLDPCYCTPLDDFWVFGC